ncbi:hypothetical protein ACFLZN_01760 [Nanoarchaeota archaeon]
MVTFRAFIMFLTSIITKTMFLKKMRFSDAWRYCFSKIKKRPSEVVKFLALYFVFLLLFQGIFLLPTVLLFLLIGFLVALLALTSPYLALAVILFLMIFFTFILELAMMPFKLFLTAYGLEFTKKILK